MFSKLPEKLKQEILLHLQNDNFPAAKAIYDRWEQKTSHLNQSKINLDHPPSPSPLEPI